MSTESNTPRPATTIAAPDADTYVGGELDLFRLAVNWKRYYRRFVAPHLGGRVLEVGAGLGGTTEVLCGPGKAEWLCLEPDPTLVTRLEAAIDAGALPARCRARRGVLETLPASERFDAVLYIDVLEHIEDDTGEVRRVAERLCPGGRLVVLAPAHAWLFSAFDAAVGHHRRYTAATLRALTPPDLTLTDLRYLDSVGVAASAANRMLMRQGMPTIRQIKLWDGVMVPASRYLDSLFGYRAGKSVLAVWTRSGSA